MRKTVSQGIAIMLVVFVPAFAGQIEQADSVIIGKVAIQPGQSHATVPVRFVTHSDVASYSLPLKIVSSSDVRFQDYSLKPALEEWDGNWQAISKDGSQALYLGVNNLGGEQNPCLNTAGGRREAFMLTLLLPPDSRVGEARITARVDERNGAPLFGNKDGITSTNPVVVDGGILQGSATKEDPVELPTETSLAQNYPNPFNPSTEIEFALPQAAHVKLTVYNVLGQEVRTLVSEVREPGYHKVIWDGRNRSGVDVPSGVYFYRLETEDFSQSMKMILVR